MFSPGNFRNDPEGYLGNQAGHFVIGLYLATLLAPMWGALAVLVVGMGYLTLWEGLRQRFVLPVDSFEDTVHVSAGAAYVVADGWLIPLLLAWAVLLAVGVYRRSE